MVGFANALTLILLSAVLNVVGRRPPWPLPITYAVGSGLLALWPHFPQIELDPEFFFLCFVPPLLFTDGWPRRPLQRLLDHEESMLNGTPTP